MHFAYAILPALSLLNMGVEGATIAKALTSKHASEFHQARKVIHDRQFHNADFGSSSATSKEKKVPVAQATRHSARDSVIQDAASNDFPTTVTDENGSGVNAKLNPEFSRLIFNPVPPPSSDGLSTAGDGDIQAPDVGGGTPGKVVSDSTSTGIDADGTKFPDLGAGEYEDTVTTPTSEATNYPKDAIAAVSPLSGETSPLSAAGSLASVLDPLTSKTTPVLPETLPFLSGLASGGLTRRQDVDSDQVEEVAEEVESISPSLAGVPSLEGNYVVPQKSERRFYKESREDGSLETDVGGSPAVYQPLPNIFSGLSGSRGVDVPIPVKEPGQLEHKSSILPKRQTDLTNIDIKTLDSDQSEDVKLG